MKTIFRDAEGGVLSIDEVRYKNRRKIANKEDLYSSACLSFLKWGDLIGTWCFSEIRSAEFLFDFNKHYSAEAALDYLSKASPVSFLFEKPYNVEPRHVQIPYQQNGTSKMLNMIGFSAGSEIPVESLICLAQWFRLVDSYSDACYFHEYLGFERGFHPEIALESLLLSGSEDDEWVVDSYVQEQLDRLAETKFDIQRFWDMLKPNEVQYVARRFKTAYKKVAKQLTKANIGWIEVVESDGLYETFIHKELCREVERMIKKLEENK